nr:hypothetical protein [Tanacetum cinerariifolium]
MLETCGISSLALYGGSGDGYGSLPTDFGVVVEKLFLNFDGICHQTFQAARFDVLRTGKIDNDDEEEYQIKRNKFGASIVWKKAVSFLGSLPVPLKLVNWKPDYKGCYTKEEAMVGVTIIIAKFLILDIPINCDAPIVITRGFLYTIGSILNTPEKLFLTFDGICHQTFQAARFDVLRTGKIDNDDEE